MQVLACCIAERKSSAASVLFLTCIGGGLFGLPLPLTVAGSLPGLRFPFESEGLSDIFKSVRKRLTSLNSAGQGTDLVLRSLELRLDLHTQRVLHRMSMTSPMHII